MAFSPSGKCWLVRADGWMRRIPEPPKHTLRMSYGGAVPLNLFTDAPEGVAPRMFRRVDYQAAVAPSGDRCHYEEVVT